MNDDIVSASASASASPQRSAHKSHHHFLGGLLSKRSTKVEPHPVHEVQKNQIQQQQQIENDNNIQAITTTTTTTTNSLPPSTSPPSLQNESIKNNNNNSSNNNKNNNSNSHGLLGLQRRSKSKSKNCVHRYSTAEPGSFSDGGEVILRATPAKHRSPNHNRFSHQFSLCCKAEKKALTPPVTVRYNSIPDTSTNPMKRNNLSLNWTIGGDHSSLSLNSSDNNINQSQEKSLKVISRPPMQGECVSAPESPVTAKSTFAQTMVSSYGSPSSSSQRSTQSGVTVFSAGKSGNGPIRPIAVSACRSRLRLKLYPPEKEGSEKVIDFKPETLASKMKLATTPQHMSSPNIPAEHFSNSNSNVSENNNISDYDVLPFMSHENIQINRQIPGLARQSLLAAQMLSLIPTEQARERSFLDGRLCSSSLLGPSELNRILPEKKVTIFVGTWNMNGQNPPKQMNDFVLPLTVEHIPDIVVIGTQESSPDRFEWEVTLQETLGPSHVLFHSTTLGTLHLVVYMRRDLIWYCSEPEDASMSVRHGSAFRTKGAVAISFCLFGTSMLFVTSHLTAHQQKVKERVSDVKRIIHALDLPKNLHLRHKNKDVTQNFDNVFWCGDLNFRLGEPREKLLEWIKNTKFPLPSHLPHGYMHTDQLSSVLSDGAAFRGFMEANITFPPTYKYDPGTQHFDTSSKQRAPAYTDRILYKYRQVQGLAMRRQSTISGQPLPVQPHVQCLSYDSVPSIITSDHKPVWALFTTVIRAGTDSIPLAAGLFSRDIYLEGMKRRLNNQFSGSSAVCVIQ